jgi:hypothetical protein
MKYDPSGSRSNKEHCQTLRSTVGKHWKKWEKSICLYLMDLVRTTLFKKYIFDIYFTLTYTNNNYANLVTKNSIAMY